MIKGGAGGASDGGAGGVTLGGSPTGGAMSHAGSSSGQGSGGTKPMGLCKRAPAGDVDCADFFPDKPQAYGCDDLRAAAALNHMHEGKCASLSPAPAGKYGECCPP